MSRFRAGAARNDKERKWHAPSRQSRRPKTKTRPPTRPERDSPLLDLSDQAVKRLLKSAKAKGYVTLDQLNSVLPSEEVSSDQIEDLYATLSDMGITVVENEEGEEKEEGSRRER